MKYLVSCFVAAVLVGALFSYAKNCRQQFLADFRDSLRQERDAGRLSPSVTDEEIAQATPAGWDTSLDAKTVQLVTRADFIERLWFLWVPVVLALCLLLAKLWPDRLDSNISSEN